MMQEIDNDNGLTTGIMEEIRGTNNPVMRRQNVPDLLPLHAPGPDIFGSFVLFLDTPQHAQDFPVLHNLFFGPVLYDIDLLR